MATKCIRQYDNCYADEYSLYISGLEESNSLPLDNPVDEFLCSCLLEVVLDDLLGDGGQTLLEKQFDTNTVQASQLKDRLIFKS